MISPQTHLNRATMRADHRRRYRPYATHLANLALWSANLALALIVTEISGEVIAGIWGQ